MRSQRRQAKKGRGKTKSPNQKKRHRSRRGRRYTDKQRVEVLKLVAAGMTLQRAADSIDASAETVRLWAKKAKARGTMPAPPTAATERGAETPEGQPDDRADSTPKVDVEPRSPFAPHDPGQGLADEEEKAILEQKKRHPSMGPAQIKAQLKRHKGWRLAVKAIARVLKANGYELVHRGSRPKGDEEPIRFEAPRPNAL